MEERKLIFNNNHMKKPAPIKKMSSVGKTTKEYGGMEKYPSKSAMMKHEKKESMKTEMSEGKSSKPKASTKSAYLKSKFAAAGAKAGMKKTAMKKKM
jgi:hypothetical protein